jgi:hypothetical protein
VPGRQITEIVSGGQTGVDRGALDAARDLGIPHRGYCPRGRRAEDGRIPDRYSMVESESRDYAVRTELNVRGSDATLVLCHGSPHGGTALTLRLAGELDKPHLVVDLDRPRPDGEVHAWLHDHAVRRLNVAGPRESHHPGIAARARAYLTRLLAP